jgi:hyperosmotically inducible periplasmic protein
MQHIFLVAGSWISDGVLTEPRPVPLQPESAPPADLDLAAAIQASFEANELLKGKHIEVEAHQGIVFLTGVVDTEDTRREAGRLAWRMEGVVRVMNYLAVGERSVGTWVEDVMISSKIKGKIMVESEIYAEDIDVSVSGGTVNLIGRVPTAEMREEIERLARDTNGVKDVNNELAVGPVKD